MPRKILKILISLLFLVVATVAAIFAIKTFIHKAGPESSSSVNPFRNSDVTTKYGVGPLRPVNFDPATTTRYGVVGIKRS